MDQSRFSTSFHIALACALGAIACGAIAIATGYQPVFGILAGLIVGYFAYDFRSVLKAVPEAFVGLRNRVQSAQVGLRMHLPYAPFYAPGAVIAVSFFYPIFSRDSEEFRRAAIAHPIVASCFCVFLLTIGAFFTLMLSLGLQLVGVFGAKRWEGITFLVFSGMNLEKDLEVKKITYLSAMRWVAEGVASILGVFLLTFLWEIWPPTLKAIGRGISELFEGVRQLVVMIHSHKRVLCAIDGTLGGMVAYVLLINPTRSGMQNALAIAFGAILGAGIGVIHYELAEKYAPKAISTETL